MKLLVANRAEIACRVFQACRERGITTVGLVAPGDGEARHLTYADEVHEVPSYLDADAIARVAKESGARFVHPGYGFLSERPLFVEKVEKAGVVFLGPRSETMELMGGKIPSKELAEKQGVPTLPWARVERGGDLRAAARKVGFPLLLKASAGGGGKGMRRVSAETELDSAAESASAEALSAFGDGTLFLERLVLNPRHIEVQVFGDGVGGGVHLYERECSLQRRHQKVWEEARAPHLSEKARERLYEAALKLVRATRYRSAGTVEFLVDAEENFYFLEMNTRLQVEHPVTELVTGVDLVHAQIGLGLGEKVLRETPSARGHAIEVRLYAEDASMGFAPSPGRVSRLRWPMGAGIRVDAGVEEGQEITTLFDSMLAKIIVSAETRALAVERVRYALHETVVIGAGTNLPYLQAIARHPSVVEGQVSTDFLGREFANFAMEPSGAEVFAAARGAGLLRASVGSVGGSGSSRRESPWSSISL